MGKSENGIPENQCFPPLQPLLLQPEKLVATAMRTGQKTIPCCKKVLDVGVFDSDVGKEIVCWIVEAKMGLLYGPWLRCC